MKVSEGQEKAAFEASFQAKTDRRSGGGEAQRRRDTERLDGGTTKSRKYNVKRSGRERGMRWLHCEGHLFTAGAPPSTGLNQIYRRDRL